MTDRRRIPGDRDVPTSLDGPDDADAAVVACPPHPQMGGSRSDARLRAVGDALAERDVACLRIDYGPWDEGRGEQADVRNALAWAADEYEAVGLFGYSFGAGVGLLAAAEAEPGPAAVSGLAPPASIVDDGDDAGAGDDAGDGDGEGEVVAAIDALADRDVPGQVCYGERDGTVDWELVVDRARERGWPVESLPADHFFAGQQGQIATLAADFLARLG